MHEGRRLAREDTTTPVNSGVLEGLGEGVIWALSNQGCQCESLLSVERRDAAHRRYSTKATLK